MFQFPLTLETPWAPEVNRTIKAYQEQQALNPAVTYNGMLTAYPGDTMKDQMIPGTQIPWRGSSESQTLIYFWYLDENINPPTDWEAYLIKWAGPRGGANWWNESYDFFGIPPGTSPSPDLTIIYKGINMADAAIIDRLLMPPK